MANVQSFVSSTLPWRQGPKTAPTRGAPRKNGNRSRAAAPRSNELQGAHRPRRYMAADAEIGRGGRGIRCVCRASGHSYVPVSNGHAFRVVEWFYYMQERDTSISHSRGTRDRGTTWGACWTEGALSGVRKVDSKHASSLSVVARLLGRRRQQVRWRLQLGFGPVTRLSLSQLLWVSKAGGGWIIRQALVSLLAANIDCSSINVRMASLPEAGSITWFPSSRAMSSRVDETAVDARSRAITRGEKRSRANQRRDAATTCGEATAGETTAAVRETQDARDLACWPTEDRRTRWAPSDRTPPLTPPPPTVIIAGGQAARSCG